MASTDATTIPVKNQAYRVTFPIYDADGDLVTGATALDSEVSKDGGTFADCTNEATEIATSSGMYFLDLTATEMNADTVALIVKTSSSGAKTTPIILYPQEAGDIKVNVTYWNSAAIATPDTAGYPKVTIKDGTGTGELDTTAGAVLLATAAVDAITADIIANAFDKGDGLFDPATDSPQAIRDRGDVAWASTAAMHTGTAQAGAAGTITLAAGASALDDYYARSGIVITGGAGAGQERLITGYVGATKVATVDENWKTNPDNTSTYEVGPARTSARQSFPSAGSITSASFSAGAIDANAIAADAIGSSELAASAVTEIQSGLATSANQTTILTNIAAVQADTDNLQTRVPAALSGGLMPAQVQGMDADVITAAAIATDAIGSAELATTAVSEIATAVWDTTIAEPSAPFSWASAKARDIVGWLGARARNRQTQTATTHTLRNDANSADISTSTVGDDGTTATKGKWS